MAERVAILGMGLIGGSIALGLKERTDSYVIGFDIYENQLQLAKMSGAIDEGALSLEQAVESADVIIIALPVGQIRSAIKQLSQLPLKEGVLITDVGSTKKEIMQAAEQLLKRDLIFIGGHPMAGSHRSGMKAAHSLLFENAYYILTPPKDIPISAIQRLNHLLSQATKAQLIIMDPYYHDRIVGAISHLPHIIAAGLVVQVSKYNEENEWFHRLAANGFRGLTRIGASHPQMWRDILLSNHEEVGKLLDDWIENMQDFRTAIVQQDADWIEAVFTRSKKQREQLPDHNTHLISEVYECYVDVPDHPGEIGKIAVLLGEHQISLKNIGVMENREEALGVLRLLFKEKLDLHRAVTLLTKMKYQVFTDEWSLVPE